MKPLTTIAILNLKLRIIIKYKHVDNDIYHIL